MIDKDRFKLLSNLMNCVCSVILLIIGEKYNYVEKFNIVSLIEVHIKSLNNFLEVLKHEKNASESEKE